MVLLKSVANVKFPLHTHLLGSNPTKTRILSKFSSRRRILRSPGTFERCSRLLSNFGEKGSLFMVSIQVGSTILEPNAHGGISIYAQNTCPKSDQYWIFRKYPDVRSVRNSRPSDNSYAAFLQKNRKFFKDRP